MHETTVTNGKELVAFDTSYLVEEGGVAAGGVEGEDCWLRLREGEGGLEGREGEDSDVVYAKLTD